MTDEEIYEKPELDREDFPHLFAHEFNQLRYYGHIKDGNGVPEKPKGRCPECFENSFIVRDTNEYGERFEGWCLECGFSFNTQKFCFDGYEKGVKYALENPENAEKWLNQRG